MLITRFITRPNTWVFVVWIFSLIAVSTQAHAVSIKPIAVGSAHPCANFSSKDEGRSASSFYDAPSSDLRRTDVEHGYDGAPVLCPRLSSAGATTTFICASAFRSRPRIWQALPSTISNSTNLRHQQTTLILILTTIAGIALTGRRDFLPHDYDGRSNKRTWLQKNGTANGLMYFRARYYDPATGEFISRDPLEYVDGMSLYRGYFVPGGVDPFGLFQDGIGPAGPIATRAYNSLSPNFWNNYEARNLRLYTDSEYLWDQHFHMLEENQITEAFRAAREIERQLNMSPGEHFFGDSPYNSNNLAGMAGGVKGKFGPMGRAAGVNSPKVCKPVTRTTSNQVSQQPIIQFGENANQISHTFRHIDIAVNRSRAITAITTDLNLRTAGNAINNGFNQGSVVVDGVVVTYNAFRLPNGTINVGRITLPKP